MRKEATEDYINFALIGNNIYDILFVKYLFLSQNVNIYYCDKYEIDDEEKENILRNIAYFFGTKGPILLDEKELRKIFDNNGIPKTSILPNLSAEDIINQIDNCLKSDAVYVCNSNGDLDKYTLVIWIEGSDDECTDNILGGEFKVRMRFNSEYVEES